MRAVSRIRRLSYLVLFGATATLFIMVLGALLLGILVRNVSMPISASWTVEFTRFGLIWLTFLATAMVVNTRDHIRIDALEAYLPDRAAEILRLLSHVVTLGFFLFLFVSGSELVGATMNATTASLGIPIGVVYSIVPVTSVFVCFYAGLMALECLQRLGIMSREGGK